MTSFRVGYGPRLVGLARPAPVQSSVPSILRPFVLKCPNCVAPLEPGADAGDVTHCKYCHVPLRWEPFESLSRDDLFYRQQDEFDEDDEYAVATGLGPEVIDAYGARVFQMRPQSGPFRPTHLYVTPRCADSFVVKDVRVGVKLSDTFIGGDPLPALNFSHGRGARISCDTALLGMIVTVTIENITAARQTFQGMLRGKRLAESSYPGYPTLSQFPPPVTQFPPHAHGQLSPVEQLRQYKVKKLGMP